VDAVLFRPLPVADAGRLVDSYTSGDSGEGYHMTSYPDFLDIRSQNAVFEDMAAHSLMFALVGVSDQPRLAIGEVVTGNYFRLLGVGAAVGRTLLPEDARPDAPRVVLISHRVWQRDFHSDPAVVGRTIRVRGMPYTIVGVTPRGFNGMIPVISPE